MPFGPSESDDTEALSKLLLQQFRAPTQGDGEADDEADAVAEDEADGDVAGDAAEGAADGAADDATDDVNVVPDDADWSERVAAFNAKQIAELGQLQAVVGEATARLKRCQALLERISHRPDEPHDALVARLGSLPRAKQRTLALGLQQEVEDISYARRVPANKLILWRARDLLHNRSVTIARFWFKGSLTAQKIDAMRRYIIPRMERELSLQLSGVLIPRLLFLVADKEACNEVLALKARRDAVPPTPRELAKEVQTTMTVAKREPLQMLPCLKHWDELSAGGKRAARLLGFDRESWICDNWDAIDSDWHELNLTSRRAAQELGFDGSSWWGGAASQAHAANEQSAGELAKQRSALRRFVMRAPSVLPPLHADVLGYQLHALPPDWRAPWRSRPLPPPESAAVRTCVTLAMQAVLRRATRESDAHAEEAQLAEDQKWYRELVAEVGATEAMRARRTRLPDGMRTLATYLNACRPARQPHAFEIAMPLRPPDAPGGSATLGTVAFSMEHAYRASRLPHAHKWGAVAAQTLALRPPGSDGEVRVRLHLRVRSRGECSGFVSSSQLLLERRMEQGVCMTSVPAPVLWDVCADSEMHARRIELAQDACVHFDRAWYHPFDTRGKGIGHFSCQSHDMKTSGHLLAGMAGKKEEQVLVMHKKLLDAARELAAEVRPAARTAPSSPHNLPAPCTLHNKYTYYPPPSPIVQDRRHVPLVAALQKTVDMHSQAVFGNLFSTRPLLNLLRSQGHWREWAVMTALHLRWRAWDQRGIEPEERARCIEVISPLLDANLMGSAMFRPGESGQARRALGLPAGVRSSFFQGFSWQTASARLAGAAMHACVRVQEPRYARFLVQRTAAQNDIEGLFGEATGGSASKDTPRQLGPRLDKLDVMDAIRHDPERAKMSVLKRSRSAAYDAVEPVANKRQLIEWGCGDGNGRVSERAEKWEYGQRKHAIEAAAGKQETVRTAGINTFASSKVRQASAGGKRIKVDES